jgi:Flp pilus assembly protein TadG
MFQPDSHDLHRRPERSRRRRQRGSSLVEGAICLLGFFVLLVGLMEVSLAVLAYNQTIWLAQDAVVYAAKHGADVTTPDTPATNDSMKTYVSAKVMFFPSSYFVATTTWCDTIPACSTMSTTGNNSHGSKVKVSIRYTGTPLVGLVMQGTLSYTNTAQSVILH